MAKDLALEQQWRDRIKERLQSGLSVRAWCLQQGLKTSAYYYWVKRFNPSQQRESKDNNNPFAEVILLPENKGNLQESPPSKTQISLSLGNYSISIPPGFDPVTLVEIVKVLQKL